MEVYFKSMDPNDLKIQWKSMGSIKYLVKEHCFGCDGSDCADEYEPSQQIMLNNELC